MSYIYEDPLDKGYKQFKLTKKQHNELFKYRQIKWYDKYEYYYNDHIILLHRFINTKGIILETILFPLTLLLRGLDNISDYIDSLKKLYNQKKYGSFISDHVSSGTDTYEKVMKIIGGDLN